jgi:hypothetical protein
MRACVLACVHNNTTTTTTTPNNNNNNNNDDDDGDDDDDDDDDDNDTNNTTTTHNNRYLCELLEQENAREAERQLLLAENRTPGSTGENDVTRRLAKIFHAEREARRVEIARIVRRTREKLQRFGSGGGGGGGDDNDDDFGESGSAADEQTQQQQQQQQQQSPPVPRRFVSAEPVGEALLRRQFPVLPKLQLSSLGSGGGAGGSSSGGGGGGGGGSQQQPQRVSPRELNDDFFENHPAYKALYARYGGEVSTCGATSPPLTAVVAATGSNDSGNGTDGTDGGGGGHAGDDGEFSLWDSMDGLVEEAAAVRVQAAVRGTQQRGRSAVAAASSP